MAKGRRRRKSRRIMWSRRRSRRRASRTARGLLDAARSLFGCRLRASWVSWRSWGGLLERL
eukprot:6595125-Pyramimonas_sp.AAC.1